MAGLKVTDLEEKLRELIHSGRNPSITSMKTLGFAVGYPASNPTAAVSHWWKRGGGIPADKLNKLCAAFDIEPDWLRVTSLDEFCAKLTNAPHRTGGSLWARMTSAVSSSMAHLTLGFRFAEVSRGHPRFGKASPPDLPEVMAEQGFAIELRGTLAYHGWHATILTHDGANFFSLCPSPEVPAITVGNIDTLLFPPPVQSADLLRYGESDIGSHWLFVVLTRKEWPRNLATNLARKDLAPHEVAGLLEDLAAECQDQPVEDWVLIKQQFRVIPPSAISFVTPQSK